MKLYSRESGQGDPLIILHGLFGSSDNWYTLAKTFAAQFKVYLVDQRNHGQSPHSEEFNYNVMTEDLNEFFIDHHIDKATVIGHSMGGKTAMNFAVRFPDKVNRLIVVDITPRFYPLRHDYIINGLRSIDLATLESRTQADELLSQSVPEKDERQFLLKNLSRTPEGKFEWKPDVEAISKNIGEVGKDMQYPGSYTGPSLFVRGARSNYYKPDDEANILTIFAKAKFVSIDSGHWVQAEKPHEFAQAVLDFLKS
jgi:esterase